jgi:hypothetical protein
MTGSRAWPARVTIGQTRVGALRGHALWLSLWQSGLHDHAESLWPYAIIKLSGQPGRQTFTSHPPAR